MRILGVPKSTFKRHWHQCGLASLKNRGSSEEEAKHFPAKHFAKRTTVSEKARKE
jgi:hypothetical protein